MSVTEQVPGLVGDYLGQCGGEAGDIHALAIQSVSLDEGDIRTVQVADIDAFG